ncbi:protein of unknown function [Nitrospira japonica]|uniref:Uncharacterized protein n=1 Tax=Nitrospira japonica TaxID=1325564 RepID=A0A1W1I3G2_9BACT|nr:protein of unknown function [Nitrospira japonica]
MASSPRYSRVLYRSFVSPSRGVMRIDLHRPTEQTGPAGTCLTAYAALSRIRLSSTTPV